MGRSIVGKGIHHVTVGGCSDKGGRSNVKRCVFNFFRKIVTILLHVFQEAIYSTRAVRQPQTMNGRNLFLTADLDVITSYFRISVFAGVSQNVINL